MQKTKVFGMKEYSREKAPTGKTNPVNGKFIKTYFIYADDIDEARRKLASHLVGKDEEQDLAKYGLFYASLVDEFSKGQLMRVPWNRREFVH